MYEKINLVVGNDNGNSEHDLVINGEVIQNPNVISEENEIPNLEELDHMNAVENIHERLLVTIQEPTSLLGHYYIGSYAVNSDRFLENIDIGTDNAKSSSNIPIINTVSHLAAYAVRKMYEEGKVEDDVYVTADMTTALPATQYSKKDAKSFADKFMYIKGNEENGKQIYELTIALPGRNHKVKVEFDFVMVVSEGVPGAFSLENENEHSLEALKEYYEDYDEKFDFDGFRKKHSLMLSIGAGTTERPLICDRMFDSTRIKYVGSNNGVDHAIEDILTKFQMDNMLKDFTRQDFSEALKDSGHRYHGKALKAVQIPLKKQASQIMRLVKMEFETYKNNIDYVVVFGGGSILMKKHLKEQLMNYCKERDCKVVYITKEAAVIFEAWGLYEFTMSDVFTKVKEIKTKKVAAAV